MGVFDQDILDIFERYLEGKASDQEKALVDGYYAIFDRLPPGNSLTDEEKQNLQTAIYAHIDRRTASSAPKLFWLRYAVAACVAAGLVLVFFQYRKGTHAGDQLVRKAHPIVPGSTRAAIVLADGSRVELTDAPLGIVAQYNAQQSGATNSPGAATNSPGVETNTLETPRGGYYQLILADGSHIWLDAASSLRYDVDSGRTVELTGRAYFEVAPDRQRPFNVRYKGLLLEVLGTHFNIDCYGDSNIRTTVLQGKVRVKRNDGGNISPGTKTGPVELTSGQQATFNGSRTVITTVDTNAAIAWRKNIFIFDNADIKEVLDEASRWYDFDVMYNTDLPEQRIEGNPSRNLPFTDFLRIIGMTGLHFSLQNDTLHVSK
jgi:transmembrane sensor